MIIVGLLYTFKGQNRIDEISGGSPFDIAGTRNEQWLSDNELAAARFQEKHVVSLVQKLFP